MKTRKLLRNSQNEEQKEKKTEDKNERYISKYKHTHTDLRDEN